MSIPTPSFFKIRIITLVISFVVLCFFVGAVKDAFGGTWQDGTKHKMVCWKSNSTSYQIMIQDSELVYDEATGDLDIGDYVGSPVFAHLNHNYYGSYFCDKETSMWSKQDGLWMPQPFSCDVQPEPEGLCEYPCEDEKAQLEASCPAGVDWSDWSDDTCSGAVCKNPCDGEGEFTAQDCVDSCAGDIEVYDNQSCSCVCGNCDEELASKKLVCGSLGVNYSKWNNVTCDGPCNDDPCIQATDLCISQCGGGYNIESFNCTDGVVTIPCKCIDPPEETEPGENKPDPTEPPPDKDPEPDKPDNPDDPSDQKLGGIHKELQKIVQQNNDRKNQLNSIDNTLKWNAKNNKIIADNTNAINKNLNGVGDKIAKGVEKGLNGLEDDLGNLNKGIDQLNNSVNKISEGSFTPPIPPVKYIPNDHDFGQRTSDFLSQMKTTGFFSLPGKLSDSIPGGGTSTYTISTGNTFGGDHTIDFNYLSGGLIILKYIFQIAGMVLAIRIVTLKG